MVTVDIITKSGMFLKERPRLSNFLCELFAIFVYNEIFLSRGQFYLILGPAPEIMNSHWDIGEPPEGTSTNGTASG